MADVDYIAASDGNGEAARAVVSATRSVGDTQIVTDSVLNWPAKFVATSGAILENGTLDPDTVTVFKGYLAGSIIYIEEFAPGYEDIGNQENEVVILKPSTFWADTLKAALGIPLSRMWYDETTRTVNFDAGNGVVGNLPEELWRTAQNDTGATIPDGTVVKYAGSLGASGNIRISPFLADGSEPPEYIIGITTENIADGERGKVTLIGDIRDLNTIAYAVGTILYASDTVPGGLTNVAPAGPSYAVPLAIVTASHATVGTIAVNPQVPSRLGALLDVDLTGLVDGNAIVYDEATGRWVPGAGGGGGASVMREVPSGTMNGSNVTFTLTEEPATLDLYWNGALLAITDDYSVSGSTITLELAPGADDHLFAVYTLTDAGVNDADTVDGYHANATPTANNIPVLDGDGKMPYSTVPDISFSAYKSGTFSKGSGFSAVNPNAEVWDDGGNYNHTSSYQFTVPSGGAGLYQFFGCVGAQNLTSGNSMFAVIYKNGTEYRRGDRLHPTTSAQDVNSNVVLLDKAEDGDTYSLYIYSNANCTVLDGAKNTSFEGRRVA